MLLSRSGSLVAEFCHGIAAAESIGVCAEPELAIKNVTPANPFFLIGSDGIFEFMPSQTVVDMVRLPCASWLLVCKAQILLLRSSNTPQSEPLLQGAG